MHNVTKHWLSFDAVRAALQKAGLLCCCRSTICKRWGCACFWRTCAASAARMQPESQRCRMRRWTDWSHCWSTRARSETPSDRHSWNRRVWKASTSSTRRTAASRQWTRPPPCWAFGPSLFRALATRCVSECVSCAAVPWSRWSSRSRRTIRTTKFGSH